MNIVSSNIVTAFDTCTIGSKVTDPQGFKRVLEAAVGTFDFQSARMPGQGYIEIPDAIPFVSAGVGRRSTDPQHYVLREHRGKVGAYLRREFAAKVEGCAAVVYTKDAYFRDPDITPAEAARVDALSPTHVLVAVLASAGPKSPLSTYRFVWNLAGGNREALVWSADEIRTKAKEIIDYDGDWTAVAD